MRQVVLGLLERKIVKAIVSFYGDHTDGVPDVHVEIDLVRDKSLFDDALRKLTKRNIRILYQSILGHGNFYVRFEDE